MEQKPKKRIQNLSPVVFFIFVFNFFFYLFLHFSPLRIDLERFLVSVILDGNMC